jgi:hypothetical protein
VKKWLNSFINFLDSPAVFFTSAYIGGTQFRGIDKELRTNNDRKDELSQNWWKTGSSRAWCHIHGINESSPYKRTIGHSTDYYAQIDKFFRIDFEDDRNVHNVPFASVIAHKSFRTRVIEKEDYANGDVDISDQGKENMSYLEHIIVHKPYWAIDNREKEEKGGGGFVPLERIGATPVALIGFYKENFMCPPDRSIFDGNRQFIEGSLPFILGDRHLQYLTKEKSQTGSDNNSAMGGVYFANDALKNKPEGISYLSLIDLRPHNYLYNTQAPTLEIVKFYQNNPTMDISTTHNT